MTDFCIWDDCDQVATYCEGHAAEYIGGLLDEVTRLREERSLMLAESKRRFELLAKEEREVTRLREECSNRLKHQSQLLRGKWKAEKERDRLRAELEGARKDGERLECLVHHGPDWHVACKRIDSSSPDDPTAGLYPEWEYAVFEVAEMRNLSGGWHSEPRAAIDAARGEEKKDG